MELKRIIVESLGLFFLAVVITGKILHPNPALPALCSLKNPAVKLYLIAYAYAENDAERAKFYLSEAKREAENIQCPGLAARIRLLQQRFKR